jgi:hypothetical protein
MTLYRWLNKPGLGFPRPIYIGVHRFWDEAVLEAYERDPRRQRPPRHDLRTQSLDDVSATSTLCATPSTNENAHSDLANVDRAEATSTCPPASPRRGGSASNDDPNAGSDEAKLSSSETLNPHKRRRNKPAPKLQRAKDALREIYGDHIPDSNEVLLKEMHAKVLAVLVKLNLGEISPETVARAARRRI